MAPTAFVRKSADAPEGDITVSILNDTFSLDNEGSYETDNPIIIQEAIVNDLLDVEYAGGQDPDEAAQAEAEAIAEFERQEIEADRHNAEKDAREDPMFPDPSPGVTGEGTFPATEKPDHEAESAPDPATPEVTG